MSSADLEQLQSEPPTQPAPPPTHVNRIYKYGLLPPDADTRRAAFEVLELVHQYRNQLVEIELSRRAAAEAVVRFACPDWAALKDRCEELKTAVNELVAARKAANRAARRRVPAPADGLEEQRAAWEQARDVERARRRSAYNDTDLEAVSAINKARKLAARGASQLYWCNYRLVERAMGKIHKGPPPVFRPFHGEGRMGTQWQYGLTVDEMLGGNDTQLRVLPCTTPRLTHSRRGVPLPQSTHPDRRRDLWFRIASNAQGRPVWGRWTLIYDRPVPPGSSIREAVVRRSVVGSKERWELLLTLHVPVEHARPSNLAASGACGIDIGYRTFEDGSQRVAVAIGTDGHREELRIDEGWLLRYGRVEGIQSDRDLLFNEARARLQQWLAAREQLPEWLADVRPTLAVWRSCQRLSKLVYEWHRYRPRVAGEEMVLPALLEWREREEHLQHYQFQMLDQLLANRQHQYRNWLSELRERYATMYVEDMNLNEAIHDVEAPEEEQEVTSLQRRKARAVALSKFLDAVFECGSLVVTVDPANTTLQCHACGRLTAIDAASQLTYQCEHCQVTWDQDDNAARNILARGLVLPQVPSRRYERQGGPTLREVNAAASARRTREAAERRERERQERERREQEGQ